MSRRPASPALDHPISTLRLSILIELVRLVDSFAKSLHPRRVVSALCQNAQLISLSVAMASKMRQRISQVRTDRRVGRDGGSHTCTLRIVCMRHVSTLAAVASLSRAMPAHQWRQDRCRRCSCPSDTRPGEGASIKLMVGGK